MKPNIEIGTTDNFDPEVRAMLLAMYSRSFAPIAGRLPNTLESAQEHKEKLGKYYVQWGHKSVGQLGSTTVWLEGISQLAAKAVENHPLFNGQESSTRYIDYSSQPTITSVPGTELGAEIKQWQDKWLDFYKEALPVITENLKSIYPFDASYNTDMTAVQMLKNKTTWENTIKAKAFDMARGYLPAGSVTNVGFYGTFDTLNDHFGEMLHHPSKEMRDIAEEVLTKLKEKYSYGAMDVEKQREYYSYVDKQYFYSDASTCRNTDQIIIDREDLAGSSEEQAQAMSQRLYEFLTTRKKGQKLDRITSSKITLTMRGYLDFGSYRDIHRHRNGVIDMCVLTPNLGIHQYYTQHIGSQLDSKLIELHNEFVQWYKQKEIQYPEQDHDLQYCVPMGYIMHLTYKCDLNQAIYLIELRSSKTVHQTLRQLIHEWYYALLQTLGNDLSIHADIDEDNFTLKRGSQTLSIPESM